MKRITTIDTLHNKPLARPAFAMEAVEVVECFDAGYGTAWRDAKKQ